MYKEKQLSLISLVSIYSAFPPSSAFILSLLSISPHDHSFVLLPSSLSLYTRVCSRSPFILSSSSQLVPCAPVLQFRLQHVRVLGLEAQLLLLLSFPRLGSVPVGLDGLVVPDHRRLCVTDVAGISGVMGGINQERLGRKGAQVPWLKVLHVL